MFNLRHEDIDFEKIKNFYDLKVPESETIEYKRQMPENEKLAKTISAMANTYGGIIFIGIEADKDNNIPIAIPGIDPQKGLNEKITSICLSSIYPPVFPETQVCDFSDEKGAKRAILFIRMYESDRTPHAINNNTDVYIRVKSQSEKFEKKATQDEIDWLKDRREKAIKLKDEIIEKTRRRYALQTPAGKRASDSFIEVFIVPKYPVNQLFPLFEFSNILNKMKENSKEEGLKSNIDRFIKSYQTAPNTVHYHECFADDLPDSRFCFYNEFNIYGLIYHINSLYEVCHSDSQDKFDTHFFLRVLYGTLKKAILWCQTIGFRGIVKVNVIIKGLKGKKICMVNKRDYKLRERWWITSKIEDKFDFDKDILLQELTQKIDDLCLEIYRKFLWDCGAGRQLEDQEKVKNVRIEYDLAKNVYNKRGL